MEYTLFKDEARRRSCQFSPVHKPIALGTSVFTNVIGYKLLLWNSLPMLLHRIHAAQYTSILVAVMSAMD